MKLTGPNRYLYQAMLAFISLLATGMSAQGQVCSPGYPENVQAHDPRELAMLPRYCLATQGFPGGTPDVVQKWTSDLGSVFNALHHYCWAMMQTNRAIYQTCTEQNRRFLLSNAIGDMNYVIDRSPKDFVLLPEIVTKKGENLVRLGNNTAGIQQFLTAIELKPDYWPPYANISDIYKKLGDLQKAREFLEKGLSLSPDAGALKRRLAELDTVNTAKTKAAAEPPKKAATSARPGKGDTPKSTSPAGTPQLPAGR